MGRKFWDPLGSKNDSFSAEGFIGVGIGTTGKEVCIYGSIVEGEESDSVVELTREINENEIAIKPINFQDKSASISEYQ